MDNSTNSNNSEKFNESNKRVIDLTLIIVVVLILISTFANAKMV